MAIFLIITSVVMVSQSRFGGSILITNLAYDVALGIRQAQVYGTSMKQNSANTFKGYGVYFASTDRFVLFVDLDDNGLYNTNSHDSEGCNPGITECVSVFKIEKGNAITQLCATVGLVNECSINRLEILFHRPDPEPTIAGFVGGTPVFYQAASITVTSPAPQSVSKTVNVLASGQISVQQ